MGFSDFLFLLLFVLFSFWPVFLLVYIAGVFLLIWRLFRLKNQPVTRFLTGACLVYALAMPWIAVGMAQALDSNPYGGFDIALGAKIILLFAFGSVIAALALGNLMTLKESPPFPGEKGYD